MLSARTFVSVMVPSEVFAVQALAEVSASLMLPSLCAGRVFRFQRVPVMLPSEVRSFTSPLTASASMLPSEVLASTSPVIPAMCTDPSSVPRVRLVCVGTFTSSDTLYHVFPMRVRPLGDHLETVAGGLQSDLDLLGQFLRPFLGPGVRDDLRHHLAFAGLDPLDLDRAVPGLGREGRAGRQRSRQLHLSLVSWPIPVPAVDVRCRRCRRTASRPASRPRDSGIQFFVISSPFLVYRSFDPNPALSVRP